jgi:hypothetical protein
MERIKSALIDNLIWWAPWLLENYTFDNLYNSINNWESNMSFFCKH